MITNRDPHVADTSPHQVLQVSRSEETAPVSHHPLLVHLHNNQATEAALTNTKITSGSSFSA